MRKTDAIVLTAICVVLVLNAGAISLGGYSRAKILMCTLNLQKIGQGMAAYSDCYEGKLPALEFMPGVGSYTGTTPCIESTYLVSKNTGNGYVHLGCLYGAGCIDDGQTFFCPAVVGWRGASSSIGTNNGTYLGAVHLVTGKFADIRAGLSQPNQGWKITRGYCYWPLSKKMAAQADIDSMPVGPRSRYNSGLPLSATTAVDLLTVRPIVVDGKFHGNSQIRWSLNTLYPDGHVEMQPQPTKAGIDALGQPGDVLGMWSLYENCQFPSNICNGTAILDEAEKPLNLGTGVTPTEFAYSLGQ